MRANICSASASLLHGSFHCKVVSERSPHQEANASAHALRTFLRLQQPSLESDLSLRQQCRLAAEFAPLPFYAANSMHTQKYVHATGILRTTSAFRALLVRKASMLHVLRSLTSGNTLDGVTVDSTSVVLNCRIGAGKIGPGWQTLSFRLYEASDLQFVPSVSLQAAC